MAGDPTVGVRRWGRALDRHGVDALLAILSVVALAVVVVQSSAHASPTLVARHLGMISPGAGWSGATGVVDPSCSDGQDNDRDGATDLGDSECQDPNDGVEDGVDPTCRDGVDNDGDGRIDEQDPDCQWANDGVEDGTDGVGGGGDPCSDGLDNDRDGAIDEEDAECRAVDDMVEDGSDGSGIGTCSDASDNDGDGVVDNDDSECTDRADGVEDGSSSDPPAHPREVSLRLRRHLVTGGRVGVLDGFNRCRRDVTVKIQRRTSRGWDTVGSDRTDGDGFYRERIGDRRGSYRAVAPRTTVTAQGTTHVCATAASPTRAHRHS